MVRGHARDVIEGGCGFLVLALVLALNAVLLGLLWAAGRWLAGLMGFAT